MGEVMAGPSLASDGLSDEVRLVRNAKKVALFALGVAFQKYGGALEQQQEVLAGITDIMMNAFAMESAQLRTEKNPTPQKRDMTALFLREAMEQNEGFARTVLADASEGDALRMNMSVLKRLTKHDPVNAIALRRTIAGRLLQADRYVV